MLSGFPLFVVSFVVSSSAIDCLKRLVYEVTFCVSSVTLNPTHSFSLSDVITV